MSVNNFSSQNFTKKITLVLKSSGILLISLFLPLFFSYLLFPSEEEIFLTDRSLAVVFIGFIFGLILKVNYASKIFLIDLIIIMWISSYFSFTLGIITLLIGLSIQKFFKLV